MATRLFLEADLCIYRWPTILAYRSYPFECEPPNTDLLSETVLNKVRTIRIENRRFW